MKKGRGISTAASVAIIIVIVVAAGSGYYYIAYLSPSTQTTSTTTAKGSIGVVFDVTGRGDLSFNDMAALGATNAQTDFGLTPQFLTPKSQSDYEPNLRTLASQANPPVIIAAVGFLLTDAVNKTARAFPNQKFVIIDGFVPGLPNVISVLFKENEGAAVAGAVAAFVSDCYSKQGLGSYKVGNVLGQEFSVLWHFEVGYKWGVSWAQNYSKTIGKPIHDISVLWRYTGKFDDPALGKTEALTEFAQGAVVSYGVAGLTGSGIFPAAQEVAKQAGRTTGPPFGIGVDSDQDWVAPGFIIGSTLKRVDVGVYTATKMAINGSFTSYATSHNGILVLGAKQGAVKFSELSDLSQFLQIGLSAGKQLNQTDITNKVTALRNSITQTCGPVYDYAKTLSDGIKSGQIQVPFANTQADINYWRSRYG